MLAHWVSGTKTCGPAPLPPGFVAHGVATCAAMKSCDAGKSAECPDAAWPVARGPFSPLKSRMLCVYRTPTGESQFVIRNRGVGSQSHVAIC